jgi:hypothetical protein
MEEKNTRQPFPPQHGDLHHTALFKTFLITKEKNSLLMNSARNRGRWRWPLVLHSLCGSGTKYLSFLTHDANTVHRLLFYTMTNKCTIISQIITLLHVSTLAYRGSTTVESVLCKVCVMYVLCKLSIFVTFMYFYVRNILCILFHCVVLCTVCV